MRVKSLVLSDGFVKGVAVNDKGENRILTSKIVVDAEGVSSNLLKSAGFPILNRSAVVNAVNAEVDMTSDVEDDQVEVYLGTKYAPGFYAWIIPRRDGSAKIGLATKTGNPKECLQRFIHDHPVASKKLKKSKIVNESYHPITLGGAINRTYHNGLLVVGDAASQVKPTTGGGIILGLLCSKIAGEVAAKAVTNNDYSAEFLSQYQFRWKKAIGFELAMMRYLRFLLNRLSDKEIDKLVELCSKVEMGKILEAHGDLDFEGTSVIKMLGHPATLIVFLYFFLSSFI
jgi:flavin-dependent dehydrogenase